MQEEKNRVRALIRNIKRNLTDVEKEIASEKVFSMLTKLPEWINAKKILMYYSLPDELSTIRCLSNVTDKEFYLPKVNGDNLDILPFDGSKLQIGSYNISEPKGDDVIKPNELDLIIVPAVAFDLTRNRLGRGKGFYDRLLYQTKAIKIGIGYNFQLFESIPHNDNDIKMDMIITPNRLIR